MLKLYKIGEQKQYWETWGNGDGSHTVHWGILGTEGETKTIRKSLLKNPVKIIQKEVDQMVDIGFAPIETHFICMIEYKVDGMGNNADLEKRYRLEERMNETLGWTGLGNCDGGSIGSGTMEVCNLVVDFDLAKEIIINNLKGTEFENYTRIYDEENP